MPSTNDDDPYAHAAKGLLKLKNDQGVSKKKKNKEGKKKKLVEVTKIGEEEESKTTEMKRTNAEIAFQKMQEKMQTERIKQKASMTHKQRVEEFNRHLDSLTEHFDIPKVSWTK
ncbi:Protein FAM32A [Habropoda laboriosa]|uniref:Protein FAM32A n=1 Tax=Habropoda laboriosa TaxID=597456 RepID=A0A0L7RDI1_9HYME|nr:PREDICTED: protein FAM32A [Habropoda laboriosa]KOC68908.1 Protein FAM32A [Habropoda laboriosa]